MDHFIKRALELLPAILSWSVIFLPLYFSHSHPTGVAVFITGFVFFWFFRSIEFSGYLIYSYYQFRKVQQKDFQKKIKYWKTGYNLPQNLEKRRNYLVTHNDFVDPDTVEHLVIVATCGESVEVLGETIDALKNSDFDNKRIMLCLATEERMGKEAKEIGHKIKEKYTPHFGRVFITTHPADIPGEVIGKGGNITHAAREVTKILKEEGKDTSHIIATTLDADNRVHPDYLSATTLAYVSDLDRQRKSYQPLPLFFNNIWDVPFINRMISTFGGFWHMVASAKQHHLHNFSSHAQPLQALIDMDFWSVKTIVEDGHQFWRSYFHFQGKYSVVPLYVPIYQDAVMNRTFHKTIIAQYKQIRRWAWGCSDVSFVLMAWIKDFSNLPFGATLVHSLRLVTSHVMWATGAIVVTLATPVPSLINPEFSDFNSAWNIIYILSFFFKFALSGLFLIVILSLITLPKPPKKTGYITVIIQWIGIPIVTVFFGAIPALEAQTRLFFGKYLGFNVTEKIRKSDNK